MAWLSPRHPERGLFSRDLNSGSAGTTLVLAELVAAFGDPAHRQVLAEGARWLAQAPRPSGPPLPGLYVGEAGVGAALLRAGQVLGDGALVTAAADRARLIASLPYASPDLFNGTAGRVRFLLLLWDELGDPGLLQEARAGGEALLAAAEEIGASELRWRIPTGYGGQTGKAYLGYAHGAAGIADVLLDLFEAGADERFLAAARRAGRWLARLAVPVLPDGSGLNWPSVEGAPAGGAFWCHGATGVGQFFLHAAERAAFPEALDLVARAARMVARGTRWAGPTQCHGLAGNIEFLLNVYQVTGDGAYLAEARSLARLLEAFGVEREGWLVWPSEDPTTFAPDYMVGYAGVAACLLRLADPDRQPHGLSRRGFQAPCVGDGIATPRRRPRHGR